jgi:hypothetical protein
VLAQLSGQGRLAVGAILGAATAALFLVGITTGPDAIIGRAELPLAMTDVQGTSGTSRLAVPAGGSTMTAVVSATVAATTATSTTQRTTTGAGPTSVPVVTTSSSSTPTTTAPPRTTTPKPTRTRRPPTRPPCFLFC